MVVGDLFVVNTPGECKNDPRGGGNNAQLLFSLSLSLRTRRENKPETKRKIVPVFMYFTY